MDINVKNHELPESDDAPSSRDEPSMPDPREAEHADPHAGVSDDPRVDPTPDRRHSEG